jgi:hypothetical protein
MSTREQLTKHVEEKEGSNGQIWYSLRIDGFPTATSAWWPGCGVRKDSARQQAVNELLDFIGDDDEQVAKLERALNSCKIF